MDRQRHPTLRVRHNQPDRVRSHIHHADSHGPVGTHSRHRPTSARVSDIRANGRQAEKAPSDEGASEEEQVKRSK
ncbi:hypothetical protein SNL152K_847 [Streptomyces sp. NL15-2K]|nr:hypothetical protein SNL152K_847 [Streptomyces sp. NL15-2K]